MRLEYPWSEQDKIGRPSFQFLTAFSQEEGLSSLALHSQLLCDSMLIVEFGNLFLGAWQERGFPTEPKKDGWRLTLSRIFKSLSAHLTRWEKGLSKKLI